MLHGTDPDLPPWPPQWLIVLIHYSLIVPIHSRHRLVMVDRLRRQGIYYPI